MVYFFLMAKDYFQDIVPPSGSSRQRPPMSKTHEEDEEADISNEPASAVPIHRGQSEESGDRSIRNISINRATPRRAAEMQDMSNLGPSRGRRRSRWWMWIAAVGALLVVGALALVAMRPTRVTIEPRTHTLTFANEQFSAVPAATESQGALTYSVRSVELEDSEVVPSEGTVYAEDKASGNITIYNNYQNTPLTLVKNTRFSSASGLIFRTPAEVVVPAKTSSGPGKVEVTVVADKAGAEYNVAAGKFTLPGLASTPAMYKGVYAESSSAFVGGFVGERPGVASGALEAAIASVRSRLEAKARDSVTAESGSIAFAELAVIEYQSLPNTAEAGGGVRIHEKATVRIPTFNLADFIAAVGQSAIGDADPATIELMVGDTFEAQPVGTTILLGSDTVSFSLAGSALLVWDVPEGDIQQALAGKDQAAFESIISNFPSVQEARANIEPFWKDTFPQTAADITIKVEDPEAGN